jgi:hypothetical protein
MRSRLPWLATLCGALLAAGCSSSGGHDDGGTTTGGLPDGGALVGTPCDPTASPDPVCVPSGLACQSMDLSDGGLGGICVIPGDESPCIPSVGCAAGFSCVARVFADGTTCVQRCSQSSDCQSPFKVCQPQLISPTQPGCYFDACGPGSSPDGGMTNGRDFYALCDAEGTADGTCIPFNVSQGAPGSCQQGGSVAQNEPCGARRGDGGLGLCETGQVCVVLNINVNGTFTDASACLPVCSVGSPSSADGGPGCASGTSCINLFTAEPFGACLQPCAIANPDCPPPLVCLNVGDPTNGLCGPM